MATTSLATQFDYLSSLDQSRSLQGFDALEQVFLSQEIQMEPNFVEKNKLVGTILNIYNPENHTNSGYQITRNQQQTQNSGNEFGQYMEYVDSPPDSKEAWPADYLKSDMQVAHKMVGIEGESRSTSGPNSPANDLASKKRRMNWDDLGNDGNPSGNNSNQAKDHLQIDRRKMARFSNPNGTVDQSVDNPGPTGAVVNQPSGNGAAAHQGGASNSNNNTANASWGDDIDFDLNNDLSSNGYMNDALFYHSLGAFKQEVPSPTQDKNVLLKQHGNAGVSANGNPILGKRVHGLLTNNEVNVQSPGDLQGGQHNHMNVGSPDQSANNGAADIINSLQNHQQTMCHMSNENCTTGGNAPGTGNHLANSDGVVTFQQMLQDNGTYNPKMMGNTGTNGRVMTPPQMDKPMIGTALSNDDTRFQYVLAAATSIATKNNEDTLTYLNQGQSYEIKLKKLGDLTNYRNKVLTSVIKICFYERRLQYMEREQMQQWQIARPGERILEIDVPLSFGCHPSQSANPNEINKVEVMWDPMKEVGVYIKVNCISTEFTPKKHGGEKGVPFRIQVETFLDGKPVHGAMCQIKVFKLKGADRKHKQDREKIQKRPVSEQEKFQPSYECTILNDIPRELLTQTTTVPAMAMSPSEDIPVMHSPPAATGNKFEATGLQFGYTSNSNSSSSNSLGLLNRQGSASNPNLCKPLEMIPSPPAALPAKDFFEMNIQVSKDTSPQHLTQWINYHRLSSHLSTFAHFSGADLLRLTKDDLIQICGLADGIRMYNILHKKAITPRLTIFVSFDGACFHALYLYSNKLKELIDKTKALPGFRQFFAKKQPKSEGQNANGNAFGWDMPQGGKMQEDNSDMDFDMLVHLPSGIHVMMTEDVISHIKDESSYLIMVENRRVILRPVVKE